MIHIAPKSLRESGRTGKVLRDRISRLKVTCLQKASEWRKCLRLPKIKGQGIPQWTVSPNVSLYAIQFTADKVAMFVLLGVLLRKWLQRSHIFVKSHSKTYSISTASRQSPVLTPSLTSFYGGVDRLHHDYSPISMWRWRLYHGRASLKWLGRVCNDEENYNSAPETSSLFKSSGKRLWVWQISPRGDFSHYQSSGETFPGRGPIIGQRRLADRSQSSCSVRWLVKRHLLSTDNETSK